jgi:dipeptidyl aminopeptidase/acylaminoacyl peptidase
MTLSGIALRAATLDRLASPDQYRLSDVGEVQISRDGAHIAYTIHRRNAPGRPYSEMWLMDVGTGRAHRLGSDSDRGSGLRWSPDGRWIAYFGSAGSDGGLAIISSDGSNARVLAPVEGTNHPLPSAGQELAWSPDGKQIAFVSAVPGPESGEAGGDPMVVRRYSYKPTAGTGTTRFDDNRRLHIFVVDVATGHVRQLTDGPYYEHSLDWAPQGGEVLFVSNRESDPDRVFNYDVFALNAANGSIRRLTTTKNAEYRPRWSPDGKSIVYEGTKRELTSSETTMEDTHVWVMDRDGSNRRDIGAIIDNRQSDPQWSPDGTAVYFTVQDHGSVRLYRLPMNGQTPQPVIANPGSVGAWSLSTNGAIAYALHTASDTAQLFVKSAGPARQLTQLNAETLAKKRIAPVEDFQFSSFDGMRVQAFLTLPVEIESGRKYPMIVMIHGGPHGQQGPAFNLKSQVYAAHGYATLMVNYRGSTGYGQKFADAIFRDQDGGEAKDVLAGVDAALKRHAWIDPERLGIEGTSYGGQLTDWLITQTHRFKAAIPTAGISNLISFNYMAYYHDYLAVEFGGFPHQNDLLDVLWQRSALKHVASVKTPVMFIHGENDNDVPIAEAEQYYIALKDVGVETIMVRYPREGHGIRETKHAVDVMDRSIEWYDRHFSQP